MDTASAFSYIALYASLGTLIAIATGGFLYPSYRKERK